MRPKYWVMSVAALAITWASAASGRVLCAGSALQLENPGSKEERLPREYFMFTGEFGSCAITLDREGEGWALYRSEDGSGRNDNLMYGFQDPAFHFYTDLVVCPVRLY